MRVITQLSGKYCFIVGRRCLERGDCELAESWFQEGIYKTGHDFENFNPVTEAIESPATRKLHGGYLIQDPDTANNFNGLSNVYYRKALNLAKRDGFTQEVRDLVNKSEACARKASEFDVFSFGFPGDFMPEFEKQLVDAALNL